MNLAIPPTPMSTAGSTHASGVSSRTLDAYVQESGHQKAEITSVIKHIHNGFNDSSRQYIVYLFRSMFADRKIAEKVQLGPNILKFVVNHGIAPYFRGLLKSQVISTDWFVVSFD